VGAVAALPTVSTTLAVAIVARDGAQAGGHALSGLVRSLPSYLTLWGSPSRPPAWTPSASPCWAPSRPLA
jgi:hypothetical protein